MNIKIEPSKLSGCINAIPSKSDAHRLIIASMLADGKTHIALPSSSMDIDATLECAARLGARITKDNGIITVEKGASVNGVLLDCGESGSTLRFILPVASVLCDEVSFTGSGRLPERPIIELLEAMEANGATFSSNRLPLTKSGKLKSGIYRLPGNISSQYITGLLFALPLLDGDSTIELTTKLESSPYIDITLWALRRFGIDIEVRSSSYFIKGGQKYISPSTLTVDGDWSNASYFLSSDVTVTGLNTASPQGDKKILEVFKKMGAVISYDKGISVDMSDISGCEIDISEIPDMFPTLAVLATRAKGTTRFINGARLRIKESDRIETTAAILRDLGAVVNVFDDGMEVTQSQLFGATVNGAGDHRIVMAAAIAATFAKGETIIEGAHAVTKSYPTFFEDLKSLGGKCYVI